MTKEGAFGSMEGSVQVRTKETVAFSPAKVGVGGKLSLDSIIEFLQGCFSGNQKTKSTEEAVNQAMTQSHFVSVKTSEKIRPTG